MDEIRLSENFAEIKTSQAHMAEAVSTLNIAVAQMTETLKHIVLTQERQVNHESRLAVLEREQSEQKAELENVFKEIKEERKGRKSDILVIAGMILTLLGVMLAYALPHVHWH